MSVPAKLDPGDLKDFLPPLALYTLGKIVEDFQRNKPEGWTPDEPTARYMFQSCLDIHGLDCPHPWRKILRGCGAYPSAFECLMCRACVIPT